VRLADARILVIDDHTDLVENLQEILEQEGARVRSSASAAGGLELASEPFDVALVDVRLPDARGPSLVPRLKAGDGLQEVLLVTGHASIQDAVEAVRLGAFAYVLKPFDSEDLVATVERALDRVRLRRRAAALQAALEHSEAALRTMVDTVQALLLVLDEELRIVQANQAVVTATGASFGELLRAPFEAFIASHDRVGLRRGCEQVKRTGGIASFEAAVVQRTEQGEVRERTISWHLSGLRDQQGVRIYASGLDVTDIRDLERRTRLAEKLAAVGTVSAGLAHEIRNPLNAAGLQLELLERRIVKVSDDPRLVEPIETVREEIKRLSHLVTDFLSFARPRAINVRDADLVDVVRNAIELLTPEAHSRGVDLRLRLPPSAVVIGIDEDRLRQVLLNLIGNAIEAVDGDTRRVDVEVQAYRAGGRLVIADNGPGVPPELAQRIFEPFFTTKDSGTGLGMAIAHKIVELHGGTMELRGTDGATFEIILPRHPPQPL
jgi:PAS domain S-box-containing protein